MRNFYAFASLFIFLSIIQTLHIHAAPVTETNPFGSIGKLLSIMEVNTTADAANFQNTEILTTIEGPKIPVLMYHILLHGRNDVISVDPERFREQMLAIRSAGYNSITDYELAAHLENNHPLPDKPILITFDDGYKSTYTEAFPVLKELGMEATVNVIASRIFESPSTQHPDEFEKITWTDARLMEGTVTIQGHTWDSHHKKMDLHNTNKGVISGRLAYGIETESQSDFEKRVLADFVLSKRIIEEKMGYKVVSLAYPYGQYSADTISLAKKAGYKLAFTVEAGLVQKESAKLFELNRITADGAYSGEELLAVIAAEQ